jgi:hypothetical protein
MISILFGAILLAPSNPVGDAWAGCLTKQVERLSAGTSSADQVADTAMRNCAAQELALRRWVGEQAGEMSAREVGAEVDKLNREARAEMRKLAVDIRALRGSPASARAAPSAAGSSAVGSTTSERAAARAMATAAARGPVMSAADRSFRLFNASTGIITGFATIGGNGSVSGNWIVTPVAKGAFKPLTFASATACRHTARITFATGRTTTKSLDFCGKDILYVSNKDLWTE